jgi:hypothetical protein
MILSDRGVCGVIDLNDLTDAADGPCREDSLLAQLDRAARRLSRPTAYAHAARAGRKVPADPTTPEGRQPTFGCDVRRPSTTGRPGWRTAQREADLERLVDELSAELRRLDEDLEWLLTSVAAG